MADPEQASIHHFCLFSPRKYDRRPEDAGYFLLPLLALLALFWSRRGWIVR